jgi:uncharacterized protein DUF4349
VKLGLLAISLCGLLYLACSAANPTNQGVGRGDASAADTQTLPAADDGPQSSKTAESSIVTTSAIDLEVNDLAPAYERISGLAASLAGSVADARLTPSDHRATLRLRVPSARYGELITALRGFSGAKVLREDMRATEVTATYTDLQARLENLRRSEGQYQEILQKSQTIADVLQVSARLDGVRGEIEQSQGRLNLLSDQIKYASVSISLRTPSPSGRSSLPGPVAVFRSALQTSLVLAQVSLDVVVAAVVASLWALPLGLALIATWRLLGKHARAFGARIISW